MSNVSMVDGHIDYDEMTPQKALEMLNDVEFSEKYQGKQEYTDMLLFCKEALEKQIPKKPIINKRKIQCVNGHNQPVQHYKYCPMCGQLMDWSETE